MNRRGFLGRLLAGVAAIPLLSRITAPVDAAPFLAPVPPTPAKVPIGTNVIDREGNRYRFSRAASDLEIGDVVCFNPDWSVRKAQRGDNPMACAYAAAAVSKHTSGWIMIHSARPVPVRVAH